VARLFCRRTDECDVRKFRKIKQMIGLADADVVNEKKNVNKITSYQLSAGTSDMITRWLEVVKE